MQTNTETMTAHIMQRSHLQGNIRCVGLLDRCRTGLYAQGRRRPGRWRGCAGGAKCQGGGSPST